ncbi:PEGA domain-containing protein [candidate division KSB1 bacterium]|nr:PEGA domain-containing protein [candidate division KSB1 bacterium]
MKRLLTVVPVLLIITSSLYSQIGGRTQVAVMNLDASGIDQAAIIALSDRLRSELLNTGRFDVMERDRMDEILKEQGFQQTGACTSTECVVEVGQMLGVERMIAGSVGKVGRIYTVSARMIDIETGRIMLSKTEDCECPIEKVLTTSIRNIALKLAGLAPGQVLAGEPLPMVVEGKGNFYLKSEPGGAAVYIDNKKIEGVTPLMVEGVQAGMHIIRMETDQHTGSETVFLEANEFKRLDLVLSRAKGAVTVISQPLEAELFVDNVTRGITPITVSDLDAGEHILRIVKEGYTDYMERVSIKGDEITRVQAELKQWSYLTIISSPSGAEVYLNNNLQGETPLQREKIEPGSYDVSVRLPGYVTWSHTAVFEQGRTVTFNANLVQPSTLQITSDPAGAEVYVDGERYGVTPATLKDMMPGTRKIRLTGEMYEDWLGAVELESGGRQTVHADLVLKKGTVIVQADGPNAMVFLDGRECGRAPQTILNVNYGRHTVQVKRALHQTWEKQFDLAEKGPVYLHAELVIAMTRLNITGEPKGAHIFLDGKPAGQLPLENVEVMPGSHSVRAMCAGYESSERIVGCSADQIQNLEIVLKAKTRSKALARSLLFPGLGQKYSGHSARAVLYPVLEIAAISGVFWANSQYNNTIEEYESIRLDYMNAVNDQDIKNTWKNMKDKYDGIEKWGKNRNIFIVTAIGLWMWNACDAFISGPEPKNAIQFGKMDIKPGVCYHHEKDEIAIGLTVNF